MPYVWPRHAFARRSCPRGKVSRAAAARSATGPRPCAGVFLRTRSICSVTSAEARAHDAGRGNHYEATEGGSPVFLHPSSVSSDWEGGEPLT
jgi:hypothetical protein